MSQDGPVSWPGRLADRQLDIPWRRPGSALPQMPACTVDTGGRLRDTVSALACSQGWWYGRPRPIDSQTGQLDCLRKAAYLGDSEGRPLRRSAPGQAGQFTTPCRDNLVNPA